MSILNFNPRSRKGSDVAPACYPSVGFNISIHAPAKGATIRRLPDHAVVHISIHAPAKGATLRPALRKSADRDFNPRSRKGSDNNILKGGVIHEYFNPRSRKGSDEVDDKSYKVRLYISIHAPAKGATVISCKPASMISDFNPRSRKGSDICGGKVFAFVKPISIHAPAKGATV